MNLLTCMILWRFLGQVNSKPFLEVISGRLLEKSSILMYACILGYKTSNTTLAATHRSVCFLIFIYLFWLGQVLPVAHRMFVVACGTFSCGTQTLSCGLLVAACMWDLVPWPGIKPWAPALGARSLTHWTTREVPQVFQLCSHIHSRLNNVYIKVLVP